MEIGTDEDRQRGSESTHLLERVNIETGQDTNSKRAHEGHSPTGDSRSGLVKAQKEKKPARGTHFLERVEVGTVPKQKEVREKWHSLPREGRGQHC